MARIRKWFSRFGIIEHRLFIAGILLKGMDGFLEISAGVLLLAVGADRLKDILWLWTNDELSEEPTAFVAIYLLLHGVVKLGLVGGMLKRIHWTYPAAALTLTAFIGYQSYRLTQHFSYILLGLTFIDVVIVTLILLEYATLSASRKA